MMFLFFAIGFLVLSSPGLPRRVKEEWGTCLGLGLIGFNAILFYLVRSGNSWFDSPDYSPVSMSGFSIWAFTGWLCTRP